MALYLEHFGLQEPPFRITPHADFFFDGADRGATLEGLQYAILHDEGIVKVSGEIGSGKTTLCRVLMERLPPEVETVFLANPSYSRSEILHAIAEELGRPANDNPASFALRHLQAQLIELYASGKRVVVMIDEAHAMPEDTLEQVRLLSNLETSRHKLLQIVLFGQPELDVALDKPTMRQLKDRITHSFRTRPLKVDETGSYIAFRMRAAGYKGREVFTTAAISAIARASSGLTRRINVLCDKSLLATFAANTHAVTPRQVRAAIADSEFAPVPGSEGMTREATVAAGITLVAAVFAAAAAGSVQAQELGRLFFTSEQRAALDARRKARMPDKPAATPVTESPVSRVNGAVQRGGGRSTVWVNGEMIPEGAQADGARVAPRGPGPGRVTLPLGEGTPPRDLRVGEVLDRGSGEVRDLIGEGEIRIGPRRAGSGKK